MCNKNKKYCRFLFIVLVLSFSSTMTFAQDGTFAASADPMTIATGEQFRLTLTFSGSDVNNVRDLKAPDFNQFVVVSGPNQSTNMQWINGQMSASITYSYILYARQPGKFTIGTAN
jgi:hypothetical protein